MQPTYKDLHAAADWFWQRAWEKRQIAFLRDVSGEVRELQEAAYELQKLAVMIAMFQPTPEPDLSIVVGSAANMALTLGKNMEAAISAELVLQGAPPPEIKKDMEGILAKLPLLHEFLKANKQIFNARQN